MMTQTKKVIKVGIADLNIAKSPDVIRTSGLGSCVGVVVYDLNEQIAGMSHIMLPDSQVTKQTVMNEYKYADTAIDILIEKLLAQNARKLLLKAKIAGGAQMFQMNSSSDVMRIGPRNVDAVIDRLKQHQIPIIASDVGGSNGRTIEFDPSTGELHIRTVSKDEKII